MVYLTEDTDLVEDLVGSLGVAELGAFYCHGGAVVEEAFVDLSVAAGAEEAVFVEVVGGSLDLLTGEDLSGSSGAVGVEYLLPLSGQPLLRFLDAPVALV